MKSVCQVVQNVYDIDPRVRRKAEALVAAGYTVDVLALRAPEGEKNYTLNGVNVRTISLGKKRGSLLRYLFEYVMFFLWVVVRIPLQMPRRKYAVIDVNTLPDFLIFAPFMGRWMGAKLVLDMHEITPEFYMSKYRVAETSLIIRTMKFLERVSMDFADHVLTVNDPIEDLLVSRGLVRSKSTVIMNAANEARFANHLQSNESAAPGKFVMMYHGTLTPIYGLDIAIGGFALAHEQMPGAELWILGRGSEEELLTTLTRERGLAEKVKLVGQVSSDKIPGWLSQCSVGILPLRRDVFLNFAFPNKLAEFIIMNKAVIVSRLKAIQYYFSEDALAFFEPENPADLSRKMISLYRDSQLQARLVVKAKDEYTPIRWDLMKQRYLTVINDMAVAAGRSSHGRPRRGCKLGTGLMSAASQSKRKQPSGSDARSVATRLLAYCRSNDWAGYDPYDALNSPLFQTLPLLDHRIPRLVFTQVLKRSPINIRSLLRVPKTQNPKALALFLAALLKAPQLGTEEEISSLKDRLVALRSPGVQYWCWGYSFPWQTRTLLVPRATPNLVCSVFVGNALLDLYQRRPDEELRTMAASTGDYVLNELYWTNGSNVAGLGYPLPSMRHQIHNANLLGAAFLARVYRITSDQKVLEAAMKLARYSASCQRGDGSWSYGEEPTQQWVDNFHTGYNLCALQEIDQSLGTDEFESRIGRGFDFYRSHFFREDGAPRYFHDQTYPIDIHCVAQSIITLLAFRDSHLGNRALAFKVFRWATTHMWDDRGFFCYRVLRGYTIRTSYIRWSQAWMLLAVASLLRESVEHDASNLLPIDSVPHAFVPRSSESQKVLHGRSIHARR